jgi:hypothetical protein
MLQIAAAFLLATTGLAAAQNRPSTTTMTCGAANALVQTQGSAVLGTGGDTFDRFVRDGSFCPNRQILKPAFVPARDQPQCLVGYRCYEEDKPTR